MRRATGHSNQARRRGGRHRLGQPAPGLEWIIVAEPGRRGRHRVHSGPAGGVLAAGVVLLATSAAAPVVPADQTETPRAAGTDRVPVENRYRSWVEDNERPRPVPPRPAPAVVDATSSESDVDTVPDSGPAIPAVFTGDIPNTVLDAYRRARDVINVAQPGCHLPLELLAAIGKVETGHALRGRVDASGTTLRPILGPALDGNGFAAIRDTDGGKLDGDTTWDRAVGPMQFIPGTWRNWASDGNGDHRSDPHNVYDASLAAARYLCAANRDLGTPQGLDEGIYSYNHSTSYRNLVVSWMRTYATSLVVVPDAGDIEIPADLAAELDEAAQQPSQPPTSTAPPTAPTPPPSSSPEQPPTTTPVPPTSEQPPPPSTTPTPPPSSEPPSSQPSEPPSSAPNEPPTSEPSEPPASEPPPPSSSPTQPEPAPGLVEGVLCTVTGLLGLCP